MMWAFGEDTGSLLSKTTGGKKLRKWDWKWGKVNIEQFSSDVRPGK